MKAVLGGVDEREEGRMAIRRGVGDREGLALGKRSTTGGRKGVYPTAHDGEDPLTPRHVTYSTRLLTKKKQNIPQ